MARIPPKQFSYMVPGEPSRRTGLALLSVALIVFFGLAFDNFATVSNGLAIMLNITAIAIAGTGAMILLVSGNVDLSIGGQYALISILTAQVASSSQNTLLAVIAGLAAGLLLGTTNGLLVRAMKISPLIVTLGTMAIYRGMAFAISGGQSVFGFPDLFIEIGRGRLGEVPYPVIIAGIVLLAGGAWLLRSVSGLRLFAIGGNQLAARYTGVEVDRTIVRLYAINGVLMGLVAILVTARLGSGTPQLGFALELDVLTAVILGGVHFTGGSGHPAGVFIGVATIGILNAGLIFAGLEDWWQQISKGGVLLLALGADQYATYRRERRQAGSSRRASDAASPTRAEATVTDEFGLETHRQGHKGDVILECVDLAKAFGSLQALERGSLTVRSGEIVCIVGDNGAGKSTLIKVISGVHQADVGRMVFDGTPVSFTSPQDARRHGIETVHQDLAVCPNLGVAHNLILGDEPSRRWLGILPVRDDRMAAERADRRLRSLGIVLDDLNQSVARLSGGQRQSVAIARAMKDDVKLVIMDEPTAALGVTQTRNVLGIVRQAADNGAGVILISHDVRTVFAIADRVVVLRLGSVVHDGPVNEVTHSDLLHLMAGLEGVVARDVTTPSEEFLRSDGSR